jgi:hypothetical protein
VAKYTADIRHVPGKQNVVADAFSHPAAAVAAPASTCIDFEVLADEQQTGDKTLLCDSSTGMLRPIMPAGQQKKVFHAIHDIAHPGMGATHRMVSGRYVWHGCAADVALWWRECQQCARAKTTVHVKTQVMPIPVPTCKFEHVHIDIVGPLPVAENGVCYLLTIIDRTSRWPPSQQTRWLMHSLADGWRGTACHVQLQQTRAPNIRRLPGSAWHISWASTTSLLWRTTPKRMGWWSACTGR